MRQALANMKSIMVFDPKHSEAETTRRWRKWCKDNKGSAMLDKYVPNAAETARILRELG